MRGLKIHFSLPLSSALLRGRRNDNVTSLAFSFTRSLVSFDEITGAETGLGVASVDESGIKKKKHKINNRYLDKPTNFNVHKHRKSYFRIQFCSFHNKLICNLEKLKNFLSKLDYYFNLKYKIMMI